MREDFGIGKNTPYKVPDGFFENISEKTLQKSKEREQKFRKSLVLWKTLAVAASLAALISIGYLIFSPGTKLDSKQMARENQPVEQPINRQESIKQKTAPEKVIAGENNPEGLGDVLLDLSDEELFQIAAVYNTDPFIGETEQ